ncbi:MULTISPECIES: hypothetical protein [Halomonadaceae]|uniref:hypothetical protein n=1 Tax=Halomonadaceae TaxID=28256 RepID=UPI001582FF07|nr:MULTISPECIES: hypothetical protein [Halomonas]MDI4636593.1 hypothetical protein [Halomonas sp. BMC7]NUJ60958.1 hypothetical protein [Halomonas taeanensis]
MSYLTGPTQKACLTMLAILWLVSGCASTPEGPPTLRQALLGLSDRAAALVLAQPAWSQADSSAEQDIVLLLGEPEVDASLGITPARFGESLSRALLAAPQGPQVLDWMPSMTAPESTRESDNANLWLLESRLEPDGPRLTLSDRDLLPYRLTLALRHPGDDELRWQRMVSGAFDTTAL